MINDEINTDKDGTEIHPDFNKLSSRNKDVTYQQIGEVLSLTYADAEAGIGAGGEVEDCDEISRGANYGFSVQEASNGLAIGPDKIDHEEAAYFRSQHYSLADVQLDPPAKKEEFFSGKGDNSPPSLTSYLDTLYPLLARKKVKELWIGGYKRFNDSKLVEINGAEGTNLDSIDYNAVRIKHITLFNCENLTSVKLTNCQIKSNLSIFSELVNLQSLKLAGNDFTGDLASLTKLVKLESLYLSSNHKITGDLADLSHLVQLEILELAQNQKITGQLKALQPLTKLKRLNIRKINITNIGFELLPDSLRELYCNPGSFSQLRKYVTNGDEFEYRDGRKANKELIQLLLATDQLEELQLQLNNFSTRNKDFVTQYQELKLNEKLIKGTNSIQYSTIFTAAFGSALGGGYSISGGGIGACAGLTGMGTSYLLNNQLEKKKKVIENKGGNTEILREQTIDNFIQETAKLETIYQALNKIFTNLSLLSNKPSDSIALNRAFTSFLESMQECREKIEKVLANKDPEEGGRAIIATDFVSSFHDNQLNQCLKDLITAVANQRREMYHSDYKDEEPSQIVEVAGESESIPLQVLNTNN